MTGGVVVTGARRAVKENGSVAGTRMPGYRGVPICIYFVLLCASTVTLGTKHSGPACEAQRRFLPPVQARSGNDT